MEGLRGGGVGSARGQGLLAVLGGGGTTTAGVVRRPNTNAAAATTPVDVPAKNTGGASHILAMIKMIWPVHM